MDVLTFWCFIWLNLVRNYTCTHFDSLVMAFDDLEADQHVQMCFYVTGLYTGPAWLWQGLQYEITVQGPAIYYEQRDD